MGIGWDHWGTMISSRCQDRQHLRRLWQPSTQQRHQTLKRDTNRCITRSGKAKFPEIPRRITLLKDFGLWWSFINCYLHFHFFHSCCMVSALGDRRGLPSATFSRHLTLPCRGEKGRGDHLRLIQSSAWSQNSEEQKCQMSNATWLQHWHSIVASLTDLIFWPFERPSLLPAVASQVVSRHFSELHAPLLDIPTEAGANWTGLAAMTVPIPSALFGPTVLDFRAFFLTKVEKGPALTRFGVWRSYHYAIRRQERQAPITRRLASCFVGHRLGSWAALHIPGLATCNQTKHSSGHKICCLKQPIHHDLIKLTKQVIGLRACCIEMETEREMHSKTIQQPKYHNIARCYKI